MTTNARARGNPPECDSLAIYDKVCAAIEELSWREDADPGMFATRMLRCVGGVPRAMRPRLRAVFEALGTKFEY